MAPGYFLHIDAEDRSQSLPLRRTWRVPAFRDRPHDLRVQSRGGNELIEAGPLLFDMHGERFHGYCDFITRTLATSSHLPTKMYGHPPLVSFIKFAVRHNEVPMGKDYEVFNPVAGLKAFLFLG